MRDLLILVLLTAGCLYSIKAPWVGAIMWTVVSLGSPHIHFGYEASNWPVSLAIAASTLIGLVLTRERQNPFSNLAVTMTALLMVWMTISYVFSFEPDLCYETWDRTLKIMVMLIVTVSLLDTKQKLYAFIWANVASIGFYGVKGGIFSIKTGGNFIVLGSGGFIAENNNLALAEIVILPLLYFLLTQTTKKWPRRAMMASMALIAISVLVSHSRGALLGLLAMFSYFWIKSDRKVLWGAIFVVSGLVALSALPEDYWQRMNTITSYDEDGSAQGRINSWWVAYNVANDRITGGGYRLNVAWIFAKYAPNPRVILVAHSIYFQMLGEQGYIGLLLFLSIGVLTWINAQRMINRGKTSPELAWAVGLGKMVQVSMIGYAVSGAFLSLALFDLPYNVMAIAALGLRFASGQPSSLPTGTAAPAAANANARPGASRPASPLRKLGVAPP
jgi:putative inorganic carbon (HCO3(-)) transporter